MGPSGARQRLEGVLGFLGALVAELRASNVPFMAGSIAYSAFISLVPLLLLLVIAATLVGGEAFASYIGNLTQSYLSPSGQQLIVDSLGRSAQQLQVSLLTLVVFLWATLRVFRGLDVAISILYGTAGDDGVLDQFKDGLIVLTLLGVAVGGSVALGIVFGLVTLLPFGGVLNKVILVLFLTAVFLPMYYVFPDTDVTLRTVFPGALVAAVGWTALQAGFQIYVGLSDKTEVYGVIGAVILLITWLYFGALVILVGATVNVVLDRPVPEAPSRPAGDHSGQTR